MSVGRATNDRPYWLTGIVMLEPRRIGTKHTAKANCFCEISRHVGDNLVEMKLLIAVREACPEVPEGSLSNHNGNEHKQSLRGASVERTTKQPLPLNIDRAALF
jgi:hypothetical protein